MAFDAGSVVAKIKADLTDFQAGVNKVKEGAQGMIEKVKGGVDNMNNSIKEMTPQLRKGALVLGGIATAGTLMLNDWKGAAMGAEVEMARFNATLKAIGGVSEETKAKLLKAADAAVQLGFDDEETANVLANFYQRTKNVNDAMTLNQTAMDLSRKKNIGLSEAANLVTQVLSGNGRVLKQYGIDIKESASPLEALAQLQAVVGGQSAAYMETAAGKSERLSIQIQNLKESFGAALLPIMTKVTDAVSSLVEWFNNLSPSVKNTIAYVVLGVTAFAAIAAPILGFITLIPLLTAGIGTLVAALGLLFSPIGLIVLAVTALAAAWATNLFGIRDYINAWITDITAMIQLFALAWEQDWGNIRTIVTTVFDFLVGYFRIWWDTIKMIFQVASALLKGDWQGAWNAIKQWALDVMLIISKGAELFWAALQSVFDAGMQLLSKAWQGFMDSVKNIASDVWEGIKNIFKDGINWLIDKMNAVIRMYSGLMGKVPGVGKYLTIPEIPRLAQGGIITAPTVAMIGEGGESEAVIPLSKMEGMGGVHIHLHDSVISSVEAATELFDAAVRRLQPRIGV